MNIGQAAAASGLSAKMIRHYEQSGLLQPMQRSDAGYRQYQPKDIEILKFIRRARVLGFSLADIAGLLALWQNPQRSNTVVKQVALQHLAEVELKLQELHAMKQTLQQMIAQCAADGGAHCAILQHLAKPASS
ncbi:Cu(I)-responsive transcriptional regulator [Rheinheimera pacifica]|uniref:Cu(I)-responsive transcriptional regulator n=1 Tax=Rheinheimera pacifica TaxID=173990 RepID=A0A1H6KHT1_9GAMM|nr:Cu(I)-responsive transcriptional regulator [Rheinheimera pacifica]SEH74771.1 Cu(I)-responsive transcriptional regulator [Rheinheimera pacifica]